MRISSLAFWLPLNYISTIKILKLAKKNHNKFYNEHDDNILKGIKLIRNSTTNKFAISVFFLNIDIHSKTWWWWWLQHDREKLSCRI
jgi:hypothetical protein